MAAALAALPAELAPMGPPAPAPAQEPRVYEAPGFRGLDDDPVRRQLRRSLELYVVAAAADFGTTQAALSIGGREANPLIRARGLVAPAKVASVAAALRAEGALRRRGHDGWAAVLRWSFVAVNLGAASWNLLSLR